MRVEVGRMIDIVGAALILGLLLRWGPQAAQLIAVTGQQLSTIFATVSLQGIRSPQEQ